MPTPTPRTEDEIAPGKETIAILVRTVSQAKYRNGNDLGARARHLVSLVQDLSLRTASASLAKLLFTQAASATQAPRRLTQQEMVAQLVTVREMVGRALHSFEEEGLIRFDRHHLIILDQEGLEHKAMM